MVRKGSYTVTEGTDTPDVPPASDARAVEINYEKAVQDDQRARNRKRNLRLLITGLILVVILLLAAIIWLLLAHRNEPHHVSDRTTNNELEDPQGRKGWQGTTTFTKPEERRTTTTTRIVPVIDPGKKTTSRTQLFTSTTSALETSSTRGQSDLDSRNTTEGSKSKEHSSLTFDKDQNLVTTVSTTEDGITVYSFGTSIDKRAEVSSSTTTSSSIKTHANFYSELTERPTSSTPTPPADEYADEVQDTAKEESTPTTSASQSSEFPISSTGVDKPTVNEVSNTAPSSAASSNAPGETENEDYPEHDTVGTDKTTASTSSSASFFPPQEDGDEDTVYPVTNDGKVTSEEDFDVEQSGSSDVSTTSATTSSGISHIPGSEESDRTGSSSTSTSTTSQSTTVTDVRPHEDGSHGTRNESTLQETADYTANSQYTNTEGAPTESTTTFSSSLAPSPHFSGNDVAIISNMDNTTQLSTNSQRSTEQFDSAYEDDSESSTTETQAQSTEGTTPEATTVRSKLLRPISETSAELATTERTATDRSESTMEDTLSTSAEVQVLSTLPEPEPITCWNQNCKKVAARMLTWIQHVDGDKMVPDSCPDFYRYACDGLLSAGGKLQPLEPEEESSRRIMETMHKITDSSSRPLTLFHSYYNSCLHFDTEMDIEKRHNEARKLIAEVGKFFTEQMWDGSADPTDLVAKLILRHSTPLFDVMLDVSKADPSKFALRVTIPIHYSLLGHDNEAFSGQARCLEDLSKSYAVILDLRETYDRYIECKKVPVEYLESLEEAIVRLKLLEGWDTFEGNQTRTAIRQDIEMNILQSIEDYKPLADKLRIAVLGKDYQEIPLSDMDSKFPGIVSWPKLFQILLNRTLSDDELIQVYFPEYLAKMFKNVAKGLQLKKDARQLNNALLAMYATEVYQEMVAPPYYAMRDLHCLRAASTVMEDVASNLYLQSFKPEEIHKSEQVLKRMFEDIKATLVEEFQNQREVWNGIALQAMVNKTRLMQASVSSGRDVLLNMSRLEDKYADVPQGLSYIGQSSTLVKKYRKSMYGLYGKSALSEEVIWSHFLLPHSNYGITVYGQNRIVIPFGALHPRFYDTDLPYYLNLARLGSMIGHEMVHAFDNIGIQYSTSKTLWKMTEASASYNASLECLRSQPDGNKEHRTIHTSHGEKLITFQHLSELTLNERFADLGGTYLAWKTHRRLTKHDSRNNVVLPWLGMTQDQLFFLANAQMQCSLAPLYQHSITLAEREHLPPELRVETMAKNLEAFSSAFPCLSPAEKQCPAFPAIEPIANNEHDDYYN